MCSHVSAAVSEPVTAAIPPKGSLLSAEFPDPPVAAGESCASEVAVPDAAPVASSVAVSGVSAAGAVASGCALTASYRWGVLRLAPHAVTPKKAPSARVSPAVRVNRARCVVSRTSFPRAGAEETRVFFEDVTHVRGN